METLLMRISQFLEWLPLAGLFALSVLVVGLSIWGGYRIGHHRRARGTKDPEGGLGSVVAAMLGLLAFFLAFTFGIAASRFDARRQLLLDEVNAIGTAMLRSELMPEPHRSALRGLLIRYVDLRANVAPDGSDLSARIAESEQIQRELWTHATELARSQPDSEIVGLFVSSLNEMFDLHTSRVTHLMYYRIPGSIWIGLMVVTVFSMGAVGLQFGMSGRNDPVLLGALAVAYSAVVLLIADLDHPSKGVLRVSQRPMIELRQKLSAPP